MTSNGIAEYFQLTSKIELDRVIQNVVTELVDKKFTFQALFTDLEVYLTSKDNQKRSKAIHFVSDLIVNLPSNYLNALEADTLSTFLCSKLDDHYSVSTATLPGLRSLVKNYKLNSISDAKLLFIIKSLLRDIHVQSMVQSDRYTVFDIYKFVLSTNKLIELIKSENYDSDFVYGFIQSMDGEKDPRNLMICFECLRLMCQELKLGPFVEETFEIFACYFPIDFTPPKSESFTITKEMLIESLRKCFSSNKQFAKFAIPLFLDKLESNLESSQPDSLETFSECSRTTYDPNEYKAQLEPLLSTIHKIVMNATKTNLEEAALSSLEAMSFSISRTIQFVDLNAESSNEVSIEWFVNKIAENCLGYLNEPDLKLVWPNVKCLHSVAAASSTANLLILKKTIPALMKHYESTNFQNQKKTYLDILWQFVGGCFKFDNKAPSPIKQHINELLSICITNEPNKHLKLQSLNGFLNLLQFENLVETAKLVDESSSNNFEAISKCLWHSLWFANSQNLTEAGQEEREKTIKIFYILINKDMKLLNWFFTSLSEINHKSSELATNDESNKLINSLEIIDKLSYYFSVETTSSSSHQKMINEILNYLENLILHINENDSYNNRLYFSIFDCLNNVVRNLNKRPYVNEIEIVLDRIIQSLLDLIGNDCFTKLFFYDSIVRYSLIFREYSLHFKEKSDLATKFLAKVEKVFLEESNFKSFELESCIKEKLKLNILMQTVCSLDKKVFSDWIESVFLKIDDKLKKLATESNEKQNEKEQENISRMAAQFYAAVLNKLENSDLLNKRLESIKGCLLTQIENSSNKNSTRLRHIEMWIWITKAMVLREHNSFNELSMKLIDWLDNEIFCKRCSDAFNIILNDSIDDCHVMNNKQIANIKMFYRQRFFNSAINLLITKFQAKNETNIDRKFFYAVSILNMVCLLPKEVIQKHLETMIPVILYSLNNIENEDEKVLFSSLKSFEILLFETLQKENQQLESYTQDILKKLILLCNYKKNMEIRLLALKCINNLALTLPPNKIIQYQKHVCHKLEPCLSDKKRLCRQKAVEARNRWYLLTTKNVEN